MRRRLMPIWAVLRHALTPAVRGAGAAVPTVAAVTSLIGLPVIGLLAGIPVGWIVAVVGVGLVMLILRSAVYFYREAHPEFPRHDLNVKSLWYADLPSAARETEARVVFLPVEFINREPNQPVILQFDLCWRRDDGTAFPVSHFRGRSIPDALPWPVRIEPQSRQEGYVVFDGEFTLAFEYGDEMDVTVRDRFSAFVRITDKLTNATTEHDLPGNLSAS